ncbi:phage baseplate assembly protein V [Sediminispirochaeta bajacaliforniensis]|uniref:phage baseplate assembly protein V n=1 Tax=Sediminispirochaeta bajacaliforniensis TaxID=148 RepID=UPI00036F2E3F|nr:phage baseplate assembly protein V [Sediminispirochaeta bajacaliforniensis]
MRNEVCMYHGIVTDNQDPDGLGRVRISLPEIQGGDQSQTNWLPILTPFAGNQTGGFFLPEIEDVVIALFFDDGLEQGVVLGAAWNHNHMPPATEENSAADLNDDGTNSLHFLRSRSGMRIILDDSDGEEKLQLLNTDATTRVEMLVGEEILNIETEADINISSGGVINIEAEEISISTENELSFASDALGIESDGDTTLSASGNLGIEGNGVAMN